MFYSSSESGCSAPLVILFISLSTLVVPSFSQLILDYRVPLNAKVADIDNPGSALGKLTQFKIIGSNTVNDAYEFQKTPNGKFQSITFKINDNSIFKPDKNPKNDQVGFRSVRDALFYHRPGFQHVLINDLGFLFLSSRNDLLPKYDAKAIETKKRTYHHVRVFLIFLRRT
jgi:hypothetical protein